MRTPVETPAKQEEFHVKEEPEQEEEYMPSDISLPQRL